MSDTILALDRLDQIKPLIENALAEDIGSGDVTTLCIVPPEMALRKEIHQVENLLHQVEADSEQMHIRRRLGLLRARLALHGGEVNLLLQHGAYRDRLIRRLARDRNGR